MYGRTQKYGKSMSRYISLIFFLAVSIATAIVVRGLLIVNDFNGTTLIQLGSISLNLKYTINTGINFGLASEAHQSRQFLLAALAAVISLAIIFWGSKSHLRWSGVAAGLFAGGGLANASERVFYGGVFDYINFNISFLNNPYAFNLADIYIFLGLILYLIAPRNTVDPANGPAYPSGLKIVLIFIGNSILSLSLLISCIYIAWQILAQFNFLYGVIYERHDLETHINTYAPQNRNKNNFEFTTREDRIAIFKDIATAINSDGTGLNEITYSNTASTSEIPFLVRAERDHLQDVANLVSKLKPIGALTASALLIFYAFCFYYKTSRYEYYWRPSGILASFMQLTIITFALGTLTAILGAQRTFYLLHEWAFSDKAQWFFYYQDSLMTTLMPEVVFADISILLILITTVVWVITNLTLRQVLE